MGQVRHESATTTHAARSKTQRSQASVVTLSRELKINPKAVAKWRNRATVEDLKAPHSTTLTEAGEAMVVAVRRHTLLPLDDCLYALQRSIPHMTRSALHRCLQQHGISRLPDIEGGKPNHAWIKGQNLPRRRRGSSGWTNHQGGDRQTLPSRGLAMPSFMENIPVRRA